MTIPLFEKLFSTWVDYKSAKFSPNTRVILMILNTCYGGKPR